LIQLRTFIQHFKYFPSLQKDFKVQFTPPLELGLNFVFNKKNKRSCKQNSNNRTIITSCSFVIHLKRILVSISFLFEWSKWSVSGLRVEGSRLLCFVIRVEGEKGMSRVGSSEEEIVSVWERSLGFVWIHLLKKKRVTQICWRVDLAKTEHFVRMRKC